MRSPIGNKKAVELSLQKVIELIIIGVVILVIILVVGKFFQDSPNVILTPSQALAIEKCERTDKLCNIERCTKDMLLEKSCEEKDFKRWEMWEKYFKQCDSSDIDNEKKENLGCGGKLHEKFKNLLNENRADKDRTDGDRTDEDRKDEDKTNTNKEKIKDEIERGGMIKLSECVVSCNCNRGCYTDERPGKRYEGVRDIVWSKLKAVHQDIGLNKPLIINSAYRSPKHNDDVSDARNSEHLRGTAVDISTRGWSYEKMKAFICSARKYGFKGMGVNKEAEFIHIDIRLKFTTWNYKKKNWGNLEQFKKSSSCPLTA